MSASRPPLTDEELRRELLNRFSGGNLAPEDRSRLVQLAGAKSWRSTPRFVPRIARWVVGTAVAAVALGVAAIVIIPALQTNRVPETPQAGGVQQPAPPETTTATIPAGASKTPAQTKASVGPTANVGSTWGPLAVATDVIGPDALAAGTLRVGERCVVLRFGGTDYTLVWPRERTSWDPNRSAVEFRRDSGDLAVAMDGESVTVGGGITGEELPWVVTPKDACPRPLWLVRDLRVGET